jgi:hypothetical protein
MRPCCFNDEVGRSHKISQALFKLKGIPASNLYREQISVRVDVRSKIWIQMDKAVMKRRDF